MDKTYILSVPEEYQGLAREISMVSGKIYSKAVNFFKRIQTKGINVSRKTYDQYMEWLLRGTIKQPKKVTIK